MAENQSTPPQVPIEALTQADRTRRVDQSQLFYAEFTKLLSAIASSDSGDSDAVRGALSLSFQELKKYLDSLDGYENIFVCGPCWWGTYPMAVLSLLERLDWTGKKVLPLMTHEGSGLGSAERTLRSVCSGATVARGLAVHGAETAGRESEIAAWAKKNG